MAYFKVNGGVPLNGEVSVSGSKNAALPILCASVLADAPCRIENLPEIEDVKRLIEILTAMGATVECPESGVAVIDPSTIKDRRVSTEMATKLRASYYMLGSLLGRYGEAEVAEPGGCAIGQRPMDYHINGMRSLGADVIDRGGIIIARADELCGSDIFLDMASVGATINIMLAASRAKGKTTINNAAREPHVVDVANFLNAMGASIRGAGTDVIRINGREKLHGCTYAVIPDQIEAGTYMIAAAATKGNVVIKNLIPAHLEAISAKLMECGIDVVEGDSGSEFYIRVSAHDRPRPVNIRTLPYPGFPTDLQQPMTALLAISYGNSFITENLFEDRFNHVRELNRMGAHITVNGRTALVAGLEKLYGAEIHATDLRAGAAMIVAALMAEGESIIRNVHYIDRGYEHLVEKLCALGARIERVTE
ncbi:MAG: UDP-N-acetylglucosamine 1-carboxyvinyltransferase [Clostridia bacterium]|nr:UDP-N-acetylglucosamine 1-carboxyvinyltransferase [Clostridia bacterium]